MSETVLMERFGKVARLTLNRPDRLNAINDTLRSELESHLRDIAADDGISVVVLRGAGRAFCTGYDLTALPGNTSSATTAEDAPAQSSYLGGLSVTEDQERLRQTVERWMALWSFPKPVIAQIHGYCIAGGGELAAMCDIGICADDAKFGHPAARAVGIPPTLCFWPMKIGLARTKELLFTGDLVDGRDAAQMGLVNRSVPPERLEAEVMHLAERIALMPLEALRIHKSVANRWFETIGIRTCASIGVEYDVLFHQTATAAEFSRRVQTEGLSSALEARDGPFKRQRQAFEAEMNNPDDKTRTVG